MQILVRALLLATGLLSLGGCGQPGALYLPTEPAAAQRATLLQTLVPANPFEVKPTTPTSPTVPKPVAPSTSTPSTPASVPTAQ